MIPVVNRCLPRTREREVYLLPRETPILASLIDAHVNLSLRRLYAVLPSGYLRTEGRYFRLEGILERFRANIPRRVEVR